MTAALLIEHANAPAYTYRAVLVSIYDGDSLTCDIDLGFNMWMKAQKIRLYGINTPELRGPERKEGLAVRDAVRSALPDGEQFLLRTVKDKSGKFGRWLGVIHHPAFPPTLNQWLLDNNMARPYFP